MAELTLYLGNRNYSSWSFRAWLALRRTGAAFQEEVFDLSQADVRSRVRRHSPTGKVPALQHGDLVVWDSLAIIEYLAESYPASGLWPQDAATRATARSVSAEMHSSFPVLRRAMPMNVRRSSPGKGRAHGIVEEIGRITRIWRDCRGRFAATGPYLFGSWTAADIMYAPVVSRFLTYAVDVDEPCREYMDAVWGREDVGVWRAAAAAESGIQPHYDL